MESAGCSKTKADTICDVCVLVSSVLRQNTKCLATWGPEQLQRESYAGFAGI